MRTIALGNSLELHTIEGTTVTAKKKSAYAQAGVDIDEMMRSLAAVKKMVKSTSRREVLSDIGSFGGLFASPGKDTVLVASTDGVGTKLKIAVLTKRHNTVGQDLVNHCANDILVQGARPLFFLDYIGTSQLSSDMFRDVVSGLCKACKQNNCALLGGETAEMPGLYPKGEYDLVGTIVGVVPKSGLITGKRIRRGDVILGLRSTGLHTNGYSLARRVILEQEKLTVNDQLPGTRKTVGDILLAVHKSYVQPIDKLMKKVRVHGMAHITGGGLPDNVARIMPAGNSAVIDRSSWKVPAVFRYIEERGGIDHDEMYRVFNMGIGMTVVIARKDLAMTEKILTAARCRPIIIGTVKAGPEPVVLEN
jgi:phosphoribosylformylglycinamidine cyclo-ligase